MQFWCILLLFFKDILVLSLSYCLMTAQPFRVYMTGQLCLLLNGAISLVYIFSRVSDLLFPPLHVFSVHMLCS